MVAFGFSRRRLGQTRPIRLRAWKRIIWYWSMIKCVCYPAFYASWPLELGKKVNCITATVNNTCDGFGTRPRVIEFLYEEDIGNKYSERA